MRICRGKLKRGLSVCIIFSIIFTFFLVERANSVMAASKYVTRSQMIKMILDELNTTYDKDSSTSYITKAKEIGLITKNTFTKYDCYANKTEVAMLLVRADEYLNGKTVKDELVTRIIECRISDISKIRKVYRPFLAKAYALGYIKGNSNGVYSTNRKFNPKNKVTITYAKQLVRLINDKDSRHQISPDGQLIRTTKLPKMAEFYPYILESYPNSYYDWQFLFMRAKDGEEPIYGTDKWRNKIDYVTPVDFFDYKDGQKEYWYYYSHDPVSTKELYDICIDKWEENARKYLECVFNVNYKTIENETEWKEKLLLTDFNGVHFRKSAEQFIDNYIQYTIENKTIIESKLIGVDRSTIYIADGSIYMKAFVKYRVSSGDNLEISTDNPLIYTRSQYTYLNEINLNEWNDCYINMQLSSGSPNYGIKSAIINDYFHDIWVVDLWKE